MKNIGNLYHLASLKNMQFIIKNQKLKFYRHYEADEDYDYISLTRDKYLDNIKFIDQYKLFKLIIDGNKLSENYKLRPYRYDISQDNEFEERVIATEIKNVFKYIKGVVFIINKELKDRKKMLDKKHIHTLDDLYEYCKRKHIDDLSLYYINICNILDYLERHKIELYVQNANVINKDYNLMYSYLIIE